MNLHTKLVERETAGRPIRVGLIGAGKFGSMFLTQAIRTPGIHVAAIIDLRPAVVRENILSLGWTGERVSAGSIDEAIRTGGTWVGEDVDKMIGHGAIDLVIECTGHPIAAVAHCLKAFAAGKPVVNVTVEADALCGPLLARRAREAGVIYSLAYGDQPSMACELVDWARTSGFRVVAAGRGHKWHPDYRFSTPETVWKHWGLGNVDETSAKAGGLNPKMFNAFLDGSKPAIECTALANATGLHAPRDGLAYPAGGIDEIATLMRPREEGGVLEAKGLVETISSVHLDGTEIPYNIRPGVFVAFELESDYAQQCLREYSIVTDPSGRYMSLYRRWHMIGLELGVSVASVMLRGEATGAPRTFNADAIATAKRDMQPGEMLDGEGGFTVYGKLMPADQSLDGEHLPLGLAHGIRLIRPVRRDQPLRWADVEPDVSIPAYAVRREMEQIERAAKATGTERESVPA